MKTLLCLICILIAGSVAASPGLSHPSQAALGNAPNAVGETAADVSMTDHERPSATATAATDRAGGPDWPSELRDWLTLIAAFVAAWLAYRGLHTWREQLIAERDHDHARKLLLSLLEYRDALLRARAPVSFGKEMEDVKAALEARGIHEGDPRWLKQYQAQLFDLRAQRMNRPGKRLDDLVREAEVLWGPDEAKRLAPLSELSREFWMAASLCIDAMELPIDQQPPQTRPMGREYMIFKSVGQGDEFAEKVRKEVEEIRSHFARRLGASR